MIIMSAVAVCRGDCEDLIATPGEMVGAEVVTLSAFTQDELRRWFCRQGAVARGYRSLAWGDLHFGVAPRH